jgi:hypothetical protein
VTDPESNPTRGPALLTATPSAKRVVDWLRTLALLAGVVGLLIALLTLELLVRL